MYKTRKNLSNNNKKRTKKKSKRLIEIYKDPDTVWGKNKKLENFWHQMASGNKIILVYNDDKIKTHNMPKTRNAASKKYKEWLNDNNIKAIITSALSVDTYESLYKRVKNKSPDEIVKNYKKYLIHEEGEKVYYL
tara:strand:- start:127 stop:531 length:405 start_codon:yes stop_codon:yes gene_type:complete